MQLTHTVGGATVSIDLDVTEVESGTGETTTHLPMGDLRRALGAVLAAAVALEGTR